MSASMMVQSGGSLPIHQLQQLKQFGTCTRTCIKVMLGDSLGDSSPHTTDDMNEEDAYEQALILTEADYTA